MCTIMAMPRHAHEGSLFEGEDLSPPEGGSETQLNSFELSEMRRWIKALCRMSGLPPTGLAKAAGLAPSTLNRFLNSDVDHRLSTTTIKKIDNAAALAYEGRVRVAFGQKHLRDDALKDFDVRRPTTEWGQVPEAARPNLVRIAGYVQAGDWRESIEFPPDDQALVAAPPFDEWDAQTMIALEVRGHSMNKIYPEGTIVFCVPFIHVDRNPVPGEKVIVQRRLVNGLIEASIKEFHVDDKGKPWLWPRSTDPEHQAPLRYEESGEDESVLVTALVVASLRRESHERLYEFV